MSSHPDTQKAFERDAKAYVDEECCEPPLISHPAISQLLSWSDRDVLCIGCGAGDECAYFRDHGAQSVLGIDPSQALIDIACKRHPDLQFQKNDFDALSEMTESADLVYCAHVLHYIPEWKRPLSIIKGLLRKGGHAILTVHHPLDWALNSREGLKQYLSTEAIRAKFFGQSELVYYPRPLSSMINAFADSGMKIVSCSEPQVDGSDVPLFVAFVLQVG